MAEIEELEKLRDNPKQKTGKEDKQGKSNFIQISPKVFKDMEKK